MCMGFKMPMSPRAASILGCGRRGEFIGDYQLTAADVFEPRKFDDVIARGAYPIDIHNPSGTGTI